MVARAISRLSVRRKKQSLPISEQAYKYIKHILIGSTRKIGRCRSPKTSADLYRSELERGKNADETNMLKRRAGLLFYIYHTDAPPLNTCTEDMQTPLHIAKIYRLLLCAVVGTSYKIRTCDLPLRRRMLYPTELMK